MDTTELDSQITRWKEEYEKAAGLVADMHAAAVGEVRGPIRGVVEDVQDMRAELLMLRQEKTSHVYHHNISDGPKVNVKVEKNSRGFNYEVTVTGAANVDEALAILKDAEAKLAAQFATPQA